MALNGEDRRAHPRYPTTIRFTGVAASAGVTAVMTSKDLSLGGLSCISTHDFSEMTLLRLRLELPLPHAHRPQRRHLEIQAVVVRRQKVVTNEARVVYHLALLFTDMSEETAQALCEYLAGLR